MSSLLFPAPKPAEGADAYQLQRSTKLCPIESADPAIAHIYVCKKSGWKVFIPGMNSPIWAHKHKSKLKVIFKKSVHTSLKQFFLKIEFLEPRPIIYKVQMSEIRVLNLKKQLLLNTPLCKAVKYICTLYIRYNISTEPHNVWQFFPSVIIKGFSFH